MEVKLKFKNKIYIISSLFLILFLALILFFIWPTANGIKEESENFALAKKEIAVFSAQSEELQKFKKNYSDYQANLEKIGKAFIDQQNPLDFIEFLEKTASASEVDLEMSPLFFSKEGDSDVASLRLVAKGGFLGIIDFLESIENGSFMIEIQGLDMSHFEDKKIGTKGTQANLSIKSLAK